VSVWVLAGMIVSLMGTLILMQLVGITLNLLTMFGLIIVVGILVDDAIVVAENIVAQHEAGLSPKDAAIRGAGMVAWPIVATVLTTIFAFFPLTLIEGRLGDMLAALPVVVTVALSISLLESLFILPVHMEHSLRGMDLRHRLKKESVFARIENRMDRAREKFISGLLLSGYTRVLKGALEHRYLAVTCGRGRHRIPWYGTWWKGGYRLSHKLRCRDDQWRAQAPCWHARECDRFVCSQDRSSSKCHA